MRDVLLESVKVTLDGEDQFSAIIVPGTGWNGFERPLFSREGAELLADVWQGYWSKNGGSSVIFVGNAYVEFVCEEFSEKFFAEFIDDVPYFPIGAGSWAWQLAN